jgi:hypothetical protein
MATSGFIDFNADVPAKVLFYTNTKVSENTLWKIKFSQLKLGTDVHQHNRSKFELVQQQSERRFRYGYECVHRF